MDVDRDTYTDLVLISAPMYVDSDREGRVYVCTLSALVNVSKSFLKGIFSCLIPYDANVHSTFFH